MYFAAISAVLISVTLRSAESRSPLFAIGNGNSGCNIKGNISADGEHIYHVPGQKYYSVTKITEAKGERWFCSEAQAVAVGWRQSKR
ncbi:hypothetical protein ACN2CC_31845 [Mesorhizobium muleiense]|uniref:sunset domain-containing protein n=1 Tax=Mesorhizobium muleiense TaxID=1004279 RepID=UPI003AFA0AB8